MTAPSGTSTGGGSLAVGVSALRFLRRCSGVTGFRSSTGKGGGGGMLICGIVDTRRRWPVVASGSLVAIVLLDLLR